MIYYEFMGKRIRKHKAVRTDESISNTPLTPTMSTMNFTGNMYNSTDMMASSNHVLYGTPPPFHLSPPNPPGAPHTTPAMNQQPRGGSRISSWGPYLKKLRRAEGGAKMFGVFRVKNHAFTPKNLIFSNFRGRAPGAPPWIRPCNHPLPAIISTNVSESTDYATRTREVF